METATETAWRIHTPLSVWTGKVDNKDPLGSVSPQLVIMSKVAWRKALLGAVGQLGQAAAPAPARRVV